MKQMLLFAVLLVVAGGVQAQSNTPKPHPGAGGPRSDLANEATIRKLYADFIGAWNAHDPQKMASYWALDGDTIEPDGMVAKGRAEIEKHFAEEQATAMKDSTLKLTVDAVWFVTADVALVDGTYVVLNAARSQRSTVAAAQGIGQLGRDPRGRHLARRRQPLDDPHPAAVAAALSKDPRMTTKPSRPASANEHEVLPIGVHWGAGGGASVPSWIDR